MFKNNAFTGNSKTPQLIDFETGITYCIFCQDKCSRPKFYLITKTYVKSARGSGGSAVSSHSKVCQKPMHI